MKPIILIWALGGLVATWDAAHAETPLAARAKPAVEKGLEFLAADMAKWRTEQGCAACHHGPMYLWSMNLARAQGYAVNEPALREMTTWLLTDEEARLLPRPATPPVELASSPNPADRVMAAMMGRNRFLQPTIYLVHALQALPQDEPLRQSAWRQVLDHFADAQTPEGSLVGTVGRPPIFNTPQILTLTAVVGLAEADSRRTNLALDDAARTTEQRGKAWLAQQSPDETHQGRVLRLWQSSLEPQASAEVAQLLVTLRALQRTDGGWSQSAELESDAFATGQTLYVLHRCGVLADDPAVRHGIEFLVRTQHEDGTWPMISRPHPENGRRATNLNPITYAACAWSVLGLVSQLPAPSP
jgi:hypothetical protein